MTSDAQAATTPDATALAGTLAGLELAIASLIDFYAKNGGPSHAAVAQHLQATADKLPKNALPGSARVLERIADGVMHNHPKSSA